ncbi:hypothetical protein ACFWIP_17890 [Streptomyces anulatus]|uniref:hypothetical protein n=1 Tax=Streptomyces anulatus TaxID=1892 RepID=UPI0036696A48
MANQNNAKGTAWESAVRDYLNAALGLVDDDGRFLDIFSALNVKRAAQEGARDVGDVHAAPFVLECKDVANPAVPKWMKQARAEAAHAGFPYGVVVHKARWQSVKRGRVHFGMEAVSGVAAELGVSATELFIGSFLERVERGTDSTRWYWTTDVEAFGRLLAEVRAARHLTRGGNPRASRRSNPPEERTDVVQ